MRFFFTGHESSGEEEFRLSSNITQDSVLAKNHMESYLGPRLETWFSSRHAIVSVFRLIVK